MDTEYYIKRTKDGFQVAKFEFKTHPKSIYYQDAGLSTCSCPVGRRGNCKHIQMVKKWIKDGEPVFAPFNSESFDEHVEEILDRGT